MLTPLSYIVNDDDAKLVQGIQCCAVLSWGIYYSMLWIEWNRSTPWFTPLQHHRISHRKSTSMVRLYDKGDRYVLLTIAIPLMYTEGVWYIGSSGDDNYGKYYYMIFFWIYYFYVRPYAIYICSTNSFIIYSIITKSDYDLLFTI